MMNNPTEAWTKDSNTFLYNEDAHWSASTCKGSQHIHNWENANQTTMRHHFTPTRMAMKTIKTNSQERMRVGEGVEKLEPMISLVGLQDGPSEVSLNQWHQWYHWATLLLDADAPRLEADARLLDTDVLLLETLKLTETGIRRSLHTNTHANIIHTHERVKSNIHQLMN